MLVRDPIRNVPTQVVAPLAIVPIRTQPGIILPEFGKTGNAASSIKLQPAQQSQWKPSNREIFNVVDQQTRFEDHIRRQQQLFTQYGHTLELNSAANTYQKSKGMQRRVISSNGPDLTIHYNRGQQQDINNYPIHQVQRPTNIGSSLRAPHPVNPLQQNIQQYVQHSMDNKNNNFYRLLHERVLMKKHLRNIAAQARRSAKFEASLQQEKFASQSHHPYKNGLYYGQQNGNTRNLVNITKSIYQFGEKRSTNLKPQNLEFLPHPALQQSSSLHCMPLRPPSVHSVSTNQILTSQLPHSSIGFQTTSCSKEFFRPYALREANEQPTRKRKRDDTDQETLQHGNIPKLFAFNQNCRTTVPQIIPCPPTHLRIFDKEFYTRVLYQQMQTFQYLRHPILEKPIDLTRTSAFFERRMQYPTTSGA